MNIKNLKKLRVKGKDNKTNTESRNLFFEIASQPAKGSRSPVYRHGPRLRQNPFEERYDGRFDVFDFEKQNVQRRIRALIHEGSLTSTVAAKPRGTRMGKEGDVF